MMSLSTSSQWFDHIDQEGNAALEEAVLGARAASNGGEREKRVSSLNNLSREISKTKQEVAVEQHENAALREIMVEMSQQIENHKALRGN